ncbi:MAG: ribosomal L7Ae/L30e/S12e/Gadd45 family protein [Negativicutes bacterium]
MAAETLNFKKVSKVIGIKQSLKAVGKGCALEVYLAEDADSRMTLPLKQACQTQNVPVVCGCSMEELGTACGIDVGAAAITILK